MLAPKCRYLQGGTDGSSALTKGGNIVWITPKSCDIVFDP